MKKPAASEWFALWRFADTEAALKALPELHISCGVDDHQGLGTLADSLEDGECLSLTGAAGRIEVCLSFPYATLKERGAWISPSQANVPTFDLNGRDIGGDSYLWGKR